MDLQGLVYWTFIVHSQFGRHQNYFVSLCKIFWFGLQTSVRMYLCYVTTVTLCMSCNFKTFLVKITHQLNQYLLILILFFSTNNECIQKNMAKAIFTRGPFPPGFMNLKYRTAVFQVSCHVNKGNPTNCYQFIASWLSNNKEDHLQWKSTKIQDKTTY